MKVYIKCALAYSDYRLGGQTEHPYETVTLASGAGSF